MCKWNSTVRPWQLNSFYNYFFVVVLLMCVQFYFLFSLPPEKYFYNEILSRKYLDFSFSIQKSLMTENRKWNNDRLSDWYLLNWINTRFHTSRTVGSSMFTSEAASRPPILSKWISLQGPHGPVSPISQKLSFIPNGSTLSGGRLQQEDNSIIFNRLKNKFEKHLSYICWKALFKMLCMYNKEKEDQ